MDITKKNVLINKKNIKVQLEEHIIWLIISYACDRNPIFNTIHRYNIHTVFPYPSLNEINCCHYCNIPLYIVISRQYKIDDILPKYKCYAIEAELGSTIKPNLNTAYDICIPCLSKHKLVPRETVLNSGYWKWRHNKMNYIREGVITILD